MTCSTIALALSLLGTVGVGLILSMGVAMGTVILYGGRLHFRSIRWRLFWWASWLTFLVGIALSALFCGFPATHLAFGVQISQYIQTLGPFFVGHARWQAPLR